MKKIVCFSGGKDSTAMLIHLVQTKQQVDEILYVDVGNWMWECAKEHNKKVEEVLDVKITVLDISEDIRTGFLRWGFPSFISRWCTGFKRDTMKEYLKQKYGKEELVQYIGYCADEKKRTNKQLYSAYKTEYPLVDAGITTSDAMRICKEYGFDFGGVYEHHSHFNCWLCPLQRKQELYYVFKDYPDKWEYLRKLQHSTDGYFQYDKSIFDFERDFWEQNHEILKQNRMNARQKYNKRGKKESSD